MRILIAHNRYRSDSPSGENMAVDADISLFRKRGHDVDLMVPSSDDLGSTTAKLSAAFQSIHSARATRALHRMIDTNPPDVLNLHNAFPLLSPSLIDAAVSRGIPVVHTVHNYRLSCVRGTHFRDGETCTLCTGKRLKTDAITHGCYRDSKVQSVPMTLSRLVHHRTWTQKVTTFVALNPFMRDRLVLEGVDPSRIALRPTWVTDPGPRLDTQPTHSSVLFVGRLDDYKGVNLLLEAWAGVDRTSGRQLRIAGSGPLEGRVREAAAQDSTVEFLGHLGPPQVDAAMRTSSALVVPSLCFEGYPLVVVEALARSIPVLTVAGGATETVVQPEFGWVVDRTPEALARGLQDAMTHSAGLGQAARDRYLSQHTPDVAGSAAELIFEQARQRPVV